jgi:hypothetical protein
MSSGTPMRWPQSRKDAAALDLLQGSAIAYLLIASTRLKPVGMRG